MIEENIELMDKDQVELWLGLSLQIQNHLAQGHVFLVSENGAPRISTSAEEVVQLITAGVPVGIGFPNTMEDAVEKKFIYTVEFLVFAKDDTEAAEKLKEKLVSLGFWACEDHVADNGEAHPDSANEEFSFELMGGEIFGE